MTRARTDLGEIHADIAAALAMLQDALPDDADGTPAGDAFILVATYCEVAARVMRRARPSAVREYGRAADLALRLPDGPAGVLLDRLRRVRIEVTAGDGPARGLDGPQGDFSGAGGQLRDGGAGGAA